MLKIAFADKALTKEDVTCVFVPQGSVLTKEVKAMDARMDGALVPVIRRAKKFEGKVGQLLSINAVVKKVPVRVILVGLGKLSKLDDLAAKHIGANLAVALDGVGVANAFIHASKIKGAKLTVVDLAVHVAHGAQLRLYRFDKYKSKKQEVEHKLEKLTLVLGEANKAKRTFAPLQNVSAGVAMARDLASEPANVLYPESFAKEARELKKLGVQVHVLGRPQMEKLGMGSLLSVSQGSDRQPRLVVMSWKGAPRGTKDKQPIALVGKGVTFDTGGISLKPGGGMHDMKYDMCGAAVVTGTMKALAGRKAKANVVGIIGLVENMPSGNATRPGDIVTSASGKTIEVLNTDAEGRRVLADAVWYAQKFIKPRCIVDLATLTGAMPIALGQEYAGIFSNKDKLADSLTQAGKDAGEKLWRMPLCPNFDRMLDSSIADMKDIGGRYAGSATAAHFIERFIDDGMDWAHIDIAGTSYNNKDNELAPKGPTGFGVCMLDRFITNYAEK